MEFINSSFFPFSNNFSICLLFATLTTLHSSSVQQSSSTLSQGLPPLIINSDRIQSRACPTLPYIIPSHFIPLFIQSRNVIENSFCNSLHSPLNVAIHVVIRFGMNSKCSCHRCSYATPSLTGPLALFHSCRINELEQQSKVKEAVHQRVGVR